MKLDWNESLSEYETFMVLSLIVLSCVLTYYFHFVLGSGILFTHFYYIPIVLSAVWWKRKSLWVPFFLAGVLILTDWISPLQSDYVYDDIFRSIMFISVSLITILLSEKIEKSQTKLKTSEEMFRSVVESAIDGIITTNMLGEVVSVNESFQKMFQCSEEEVLGESVKKFIPHRLRDKYDEQMDQFRKTGEHKLVGTFESVGLRSNGQEFPFEISITNWEGDGEVFTTSIIRDITYRQSAEKTRAILSAIVESSAESIIGMDLKGNVLSWNNGAERTYGYNVKEVLGKSSSIIFPPGSDELSSILKTISDGEKIDHYETKRVTKTGELIDVSLTVSPINDRSGNIIGLSSMARDVTREKAAEEALARSEAQLSMITDNMADIICQASKDGAYVYVSPSVKSVIGFKPQELIGKSMFDQVHPDDRSRVTSCMQNALTKHITQSVQYRCMKADGSYVWLDTKGTPISDKDGLTSGFVCNSRDITQQKNAEDALRDSEEKYRTLIESAKDPISLYDENGIFLMSNKAGAHSMGKEPADLLGRSLRDFFPPEIATKQIELIREVIRTEDGLDVEMFVPYGKDQWFSTSLQPLYGPDNRIHSVQVISRDITDIKETQIKLEQALQDKEMLMKEIYHRVKNNLMVISSLLNLQSRYIKDEEARAIFKESQERAQSMAMIHERLYRSADLKHINFGDYIRKLANDLFRTYVADPSRIKLELDVEDVMIDINIAIPLGLMVNELISNSIKHAFPGESNGKIRVKFNENDNQCVLEVSDNGVGFPPDFKPEKADSLGLQLVNSLTQQIGGELELERDQGTDFRITFQQPEEN
ncbi:PAS domain S-box protein [Methanobacterium formicicum]|uniref:Signal transduction histidine kinase n=1 Tax=Methanobacterium formicicum (strain DSM 3637 / PP1) TaxID=1204725 RepID=K2R109_METFP|nr:PAS domain S-box protein [Methanobacterium formicicum]EKF84857.1 signal transduction histidine kinase [Methanobacterium formicicum DSM 3637]